MSCATNSNKSTGAAITCGISRAASKAGYAAAVGAGTAVGGVAGAGLGAVAGTAAGSPGGPITAGIGTAVGGTVGMGLGAAQGGMLTRALIQRVKRKKQARATEKLWQGSDAGQKAVARRDSQLEKAETKYKRAKAGFSAEKKRLEADFQKQMDKGVAKMEQAGELGYVQKAAVGKAVVSTVLTGAATEIMRRQTNPYAGGVGMATKLTTAGEGIRQAQGFGDQVGKMKEDAWLLTDEGERCQTKYQDDLSKLKERQRDAAAEYKDQAQRINGRYAQYRSKFIEQLGGKRGNA